ncbi:egg cell-secreted protein 1.2-like [Bidens hawaiensis]|uniref:egg cell-secreted protein 1.2-like n=1 Tax=Bidens hawaiensis TaxID=980011 RepID=UPI0040492057
MASYRHIITPLITLTTCFILAYTGSSRNLFVPNGDSGTNNTTNGTMIGDCWTALYDVRSCSNEIAAYFNNGTMDIGATCCEESNVLRGYCDVKHLSTTPVIDPVSFQVLPDHEPILVDVMNGTSV